MENVLVYLILYCWSIILKYLPGVLVATINENKASKIV